MKYVTVKKVFQYNDRNFKKIFIDSNVFIKYIESILSKILTISMKKIRVLKIGCPYILYIYQVLEFELGKIIFSIKTWITL